MSKAGTGTLPPAHLFVLDAKRKLVYSGAFDDNWTAAEDVEELVVLRGERLRVGDRVTTMDNGPGQNASASCVARSGHCDATRWAMAAACG